MSLYFVESPYAMTPDEVRAWQIDVTDYGSTPASLAMILYDETNGDADVSSTKLAGSITASGNTVTTKQVTGLVKSYNYRAEVKFTCSDGNVWEVYLRILCR
jgi:hypothetical protein